MTAWYRRPPLLVVLTAAMLLFPAATATAEHGHGGEPAADGCYRSAWYEGGGVHEFECSAGWREHEVHVSPAIGFTEPCFAVERPDPTLVRVFIYDYCLLTGAAILGTIHVFTWRAACDITWPYSAEGISWQVEYAFGCATGWGDYEAELDHAALPPCFAHGSAHHGQIVYVRISGCVSLKTGELGIPTYGTFTVRAG